ncbi:MAG: hypothetical protein WAZ48_02990 [Lysobacteraceae bacterium]
MLLCSLVVVSVTAGGCPARNANAATIEDATSAPADRREFAWEEATIAQLQARMVSGTLDSQRLTRADLDRIAAIDDAGPRLKVGIVFMGAAWSEAKLIGYAFGYEQGTRARKPPTFAPSIGTSATTAPQEVDVR